MKMKLLANLSLRAFPTTENLTLYKQFVVETCKIYDLLSFSGFFRPAQVFHSQVLATTLVDHILHSSILRDGWNGFSYDFHTCVVH